MKEGLNIGYNVCYIKKLAIGGRAAKREFRAIRAGGDSVFT